MITVVVLVLAVILVGLALRRPAPGVAEAAPVAVQPRGADAVLRLPEPARARAWALQCAVHDGLTAAGDTRTAFLLREVQDRYLPDTVDAYLRLTPAARAQLERQGQPAEALLLDQLTLLEGGVLETQRRDHAAADRLLTQGRFLRERFGPSADLRVPER
ncbi:hypothetical protein [Deinococcus sedimenti]|uniref:Uncharacterized protein n=1 Tax=Deinococcus sedimenti TaxID=1867090 RepID=A0ABQ2S066_9DEIO|nr:hypothetical protein [Deinococcus sedimenti]GGR85115.1 hypothetical protein GCM10008960_10200 [Deinococcus sedimenti]